MIWVGAGSAANGLSLARANKIDITIEVPNMAWNDHAAKSAMVAELGELASGISAAVTGSVRLDGNNGKGATEAETLSDVERLDKRVLDADGEGSVAAMMGKAAPNEGKADPASPVDSVVGSIADDVDAVATLQTRPSSILSAVTALPKARTPVVKVTVTSTQVRTGWHTVESWHAYYKPPGFFGRHVRYCGMPITSQSSFPSYGTPLHSISLSC